MKNIKQLVHKIIDLRKIDRQITLLAVCPNSDAVLEAAIKTAAANNMPMLFAATLNQVDRDGGYTGWTPRTFVSRMKELAMKYQSAVPLYPCLDHGGPWLKDAHTQAALSLDETMDEVKATLTACLKAGYALLHIDPTVDRTLPLGQPPQIQTVAQRTVELIIYAESERERLNLPPVSYEVGTEEVHGGLVDFDKFTLFLDELRTHLESAGYASAWPCFVVGKVGTDLNTTTFDPASARRLYNSVSPLGALIKGHYTDWVENPAAYPITGMGGANVGPEFTATELAALRELGASESQVLREASHLPPSGFEKALESAVIESGRWRKWLGPDEVDCDFDELTSSRQDWMVSTGARYVWTDPHVLSARERLYNNLSNAPSVGLSMPHTFVVERIAENIQKYVDAFNLADSLTALSG